MLKILQTSQSIETNTHSDNIPEYWELDFDI